LCHKISLYKTLTGRSVTIKKLKGFQDPKSRCPKTDQYPNVDHVLVGNGRRSTWITAIKLDIHPVRSEE
jgi:hypothetical protein